MKSISEPTNKKIIIQLMDSEIKMKQVIVEMITGEKIEGAMVNIDKEKKIITITNGKKFKANGEGEPELFTSMEIEKKDISNVKLLLYDTKQEESAKEPREGVINAIPEDKQNPVKEQLSTQDSNCYSKSESFFDKLEGMTHPEAKKESRKYNDKNTETFNIQASEEDNEKEKGNEEKKKSKPRRGGINREGRGQRGNARGRRSRGNKREFNNMMNNDMYNNQEQFVSKFNNNDYGGANRGKEEFVRGNNMNMRGGYSNYSNHFNNNYNNFNNYPNRGGFYNRGRGNYNNYHYYNQQNPYQQNYNYNFANFGYNNQQLRSAHVFEIQQSTNMNLQQIGTMGNFLPNQKPLQQSSTRPLP